MAASIIILAAPCRRPQVLKRPPAMQIMSRQQQFNEVIVMKH